MEYEMETESYVTILSGGLDSSVLAYHLHSEGMKQVCLTFDYGQRHIREIVSAKQIAKYLKVEHQIIDISGIKSLLSGSSLTDDIDVPYGHYQSETMKQTVVPNRNAIMLSLAYAKAISIGADFVSYAAHSGDHYIYPDCRPAFVLKLQKALQSGNDSSIRIDTPFIYKTKTEIVQLGLELRVPFQNTWTCYVGGTEPCGKCGACIERAEAFDLVHTPDPLMPIGLRD